MINKIRANYHNKIIYENGTQDTQKETYLGTLAHDGNCRIIILETDSGVIEFIINDKSIIANYSQPHKNTLIFHLDEKYTTLYNTDYGKFDLLIETKKMVVDVDSFLIHYDLYLNCNKTGEYILNVSYKNADNE